MNIEIAGGRVIDPAAGSERDANIYISDGRIAGIGAAPAGFAAARTIDARGLVVASVLSGNRNFEGRIQQQVRANYLASPPLVVAYALAGTMNLDLTIEPLGKSGSELTSTL